jgi:hypothetical protein
LQHERAKAQCWHTSACRSRTPACGVTRWPYGRWRAASAPEFRAPRSTTASPMTTAMGRIEASAQVEPCRRFLQVVLPDGAHRGAWRHPSGSTLGCAGRAGAQRAGGKQWAQFNAWRWHKNTQQRHATPRRPRRYLVLASGRPRPREPPPRAEAHGMGGRGTPSGGAPRK